jgi:hypothetical protein
MHHVTASPHMALDEKPLGVTAWHLGPIPVASSHLGSLHLSRQREQIQRDRIDHIAVAAGRAGIWRGTAASSFTMAPGEMCVDDMGRKLQTELIHASALQVVFPRDVLRGVDAAAAHATVLRTPTAGLFIEYLQALIQRLPLLDQRDVLADRRDHRASVSGSTQPGSRQPRARVQCHQHDVAGESSQPDRRTVA